MLKYKKSYSKIVCKPYVYSWTDAVEIIFITLHLKDIILMCLSDTLI